MLNKKKFFFAGLILLLSVSAVVFFFLRRENPDRKVFIDSNKNKDVTVIFSDKLVNLSLENDKLTRLAEFSMELDDEYNNNDFVQVGEKVMFSTGYLKAPKRKHKLGIIDIEHASYDEKKREPLDTFGLGSDDNSVYLPASVNSEQTLIQQFDNSGKMLNEGLFEEGDGTAITSNGEKAFMMSSQANAEYHDVFYSYSFAVFDSELNLEKNIILNDINDEYMLGLTDMEMIGNRFYFPNSYERHKENVIEISPSSEVLVFDLDTEEQSKIILEQNYPSGLEKDKSEENLLIHHEPNMLGNYVLSIYHLASEKVTTFQLKDLAPEFEEEVLYYECKLIEGNTLLVVSEKTMVLYDLESQQILDRQGLDASEAEKIRYLAD